MPNAKTADYATLVLYSDDDTVAAGGTFKFTVAPTLKVGKLLYVPDATYKLFVRLPRGLTMQKVEQAPGTLTVVSAATDWTGAPGEYSNIPDGWEEGTGTQADAYKLRLLAEWKSSLFADTTNTHPLGWTITVVVDSTHDSTPAAIDATLIVMQESHVKPALAADKFSVNITSAGPGLTSVTLPEADNRTGQLIMPAATNLPIKIHAVLAQPALAATMMVRWQVKNSGDFWNQIEPHELKVTGGVGGTQLAEFTIQNTFSTAVTLLFSCALPVSGGTQPNWGLPFSVSIDFEAALLTVDNPFIKASSSKITLTCDIREPNAHVKFDTLEISFDDRASWHPVSDVTPSGSGTSYHVDHELKERNFPHGALLRAKDKLNRSILQPVLFDLATFLTVEWEGISVLNDDINLGEKFVYLIKLECALDTILPPATMDLQLPESAVEADSARPGWYTKNITMPHRGSTVVPLPGWHGAGAATQLYQGQIQNGVIHAPSVVRDNSVLLGQVLPAAQLSIRSDHFLVQPLKFTEPPKAKVFRPAPVFEFIQHLPEHTNKYVLSFKGNFRPELESSPDLVFTVEVDTHTEKVLPATSITTLTPAYFEFSLKYTDFTEFDSDGDHHVRLTIHRRADTRIAQRSSHSEISTLTINNGAASFENTHVEVESNFLRMDGTVISPSVSNPVKEVLLDWDGSGQGTPKKPVTLNEDVDDLHFSFTETLELAKFTGTLHPALKAITAGNVETPLNVFFATARYLLNVELKINSDIVSDEGNKTVIPGVVNFDIAVTSMAGLPQKLNMFMTLGKSFSPGKITTINPPAANQGKLQQNSWNGISSYQILQTEELGKGAKFSVIGSMQLKKAAHPLPEDETLEISFTETDPYTKQTFNAIDKDDGVIFKAQLIAQ